MADISKIQVPIDGVMTTFNIKGSGGGGGGSNRVYISPIASYISGKTYYTFQSPYITDNSLFELVCDEKDIEDPSYINYDISNNTITISFDGDTTDKTFVLIAEAISISN